jgi:hypothetical protein
MDKVQKLSSNQCYTPSSEPFRMNLRNVYNKMRNSLNRQVTRTTWDDWWGKCCWQVEIFERIPQPFAHLVIMLQSFKYDICQYWYASFRTPWPTFGLPLLRCKETRTGSAFIERPSVTERFNFNLSFIIVFFENSELRLYSTSPITTNTLFVYVFHHLYSGRIRIYPRRRQSSITAVKTSNLT